MNFNKIIFFTTIVVMMNVHFSSCSTEDSDNFENLNSSESNGSSDPTYELLKKNISATVSYGDYSWNIVIKSNLSKVFPGKTTLYGAECGYNDYKYYQHFTFEDNYIQKNDGMGNMTISFPVFVGNEYGDLYIYWRSYKSLKEDIENGESLSSDEKNLWYGVIDLMNAEEYIARSEFCGRLYAQIDGNRYFYHTFGQVPSGSENGNSTEDEDDESSTSYEKPDVGFYDFTATKSSLKVQYKIYNRTEADVSSAKIYYGTSNNPTSYKTASVSGTLITANISGLKSGTTYYVKCVATGKGGTTTTSVTKCITNF